MGETGKLGERKQVSLCEPRTRTCIFRQVPFEDLQRLSAKNTAYAGAWPVGELPIKPTPRYAP